MGRISILIIKHSNTCIIRVPDGENKEKGAKKLICEFRMPSNLCNAGDLDLIPGLGRSPGEGKGYPLQYSGLENSMDYTVHGVAKSWA